MRHTTSFRGLSMEELVSRFPSLLCGHEDKGDGAGSQPSGSGPGQEPATPPAGEAGKDKAKDSDKEPKTYDQAYVDSLRQESASYRTKNKELEDKEAERVKSELSEVERLKVEKEESDSKVKAAEEALVLERKRNAIISEAGRLKFRDPSDALAHIDLETITLTQEGTAHKGSVEAAVKKVADSKAYLISGPGSADGGDRGDTPKPDQKRVQEMEQDISSRGGVKVNV